MRDRIEAVLQSGDGWLHFREPDRVVGADRPGTVGPALAEVERLTRDSGLHAVGFVTYEAGAAFGLATHPPIDDLPLAWFALFDPAKVVRLAAPPPGESYELGALAPSMRRTAFAQAFEEIKTRLAEGDTYQVNFTFQMSGRFDGDAASLFCDLVEAQQGRHSAFIRIGDWAICSASPESFFAIDGVNIKARPMKGTARRGRTLDEDRQASDNLRESAKQRAENVMIVDMIRNDLGRVAEVGSVEVLELCRTERYPTLWQMTSLVSARSTASLDALFAAMHPSASVTGAPKVRTMEILTALEHGPRGVYTGAIGQVPPDGNASFNVAIRTAVVDEAAHTISFGIGSGIVWDSDADAEYDECLLKGAVLGRRREQFELLETLRWTPDGGYFLKARHLDRLVGSAEYFGIPVDWDQLSRALDNAASGATSALRVRLLVNRQGSPRAEHTPLVPSEGPLRVRFAAEAIDPHEVWLFHKTTNRATYARAREGQDCDEVLLWNPRREVTEATTANLVVEIDGQKVTPPIECGLLAGTYRAEMLARGDVSERVVTIDDLRSAGRFWLVNSVHESRLAELVP